jgi:hypothetical protein
MTNVELTKRTGYSSGNVLAMIRNRNMQFPLNKANDFCQSTVDGPSRDAHEGA